MCKLYVIPLMSPFVVVYFVQKQLCVVILDRNDWLCEMTRRVDSSLCDCRSDACEPPILIPHIHTHNIIMSTCKYSTQVDASMQCANMHMHMNSSMRSIGHTWQDTIYPLKNASIVQRFHFCSKLQANPPILGANVVLGQEMFAYQPPLTYTSK